MQENSIAYALELHLSCTKPIEIYFISCAVVSNFQKDDTNNSILTIQMLHDLPSKVRYQVYFVFLKYNICSMFAVATLYTIHLLNDIHFWIWIKYFISSYFCFPVFTLNWYFQSTNIHIWSACIMCGRLYLRHVTFHQGEQNGHRRVQLACFRYGTLGLE